MRAAGQRRDIGGGQAIDCETHPTVELQGGGLGIERGKTFRLAARALEGQSFSALHSVIGLQAMLDLRAFRSTGKNISDDRFMRRGRDADAKSPFFRTRRESGQGKKESG